jgi:nucleotide-binding universal stress UspA family protein
MKSIFVPLEGLPRDMVALDAAFAVAGQFGAFVDCLHVRPDPRTIVVGTTGGMETGLGVGVFPAELFEALVDADKRRAKAARVMFDDTCKAHKVADSGTNSAGTPASFHEIEGDVARDITRGARFSDLVVLARQPLESDSEWDASGDVILGCGRPILLPPLKEELGSLSTVTIAWKDTAEAARAVTGAMPLLAKANSIVVLYAVENRDASRARASADAVVTLLKRHSLNARAEEVAVGSKSPPAAVLDRALALNSRLVVMGAYGHSRLREFVFGGFTRHAFGEGRLSILLAH